MINFTHPKLNRSKSYYLFATGWNGCILKYETCGGPSSSLLSLAYLLTPTTLCWSTLSMASHKEGEEFINFFIPLSAQRREGGRAKQ